MNTEAASAPPVPPSHNVLSQHPLVCYFLLAYGFTWVYVLIFLVLFHAPLNLLMLGPPFAAFIMTAVTEGTPGIRRLLRRIVLWRVGIQWYLFALPGILGICLLGTIILPGALASYHAPSLDFVLNVPLTFELAFFLGLLLEEVGWRGFALPWMQQLQGPCLAPCC